MPCPVAQNLGGIRTEGGVEDFPPDAVLQHGFVQTQLADGGSDSAEAPVGALPEAVLVRVSMSTEPQDLAHLSEQVVVDVEVAPPRSVTDAPEIRLIAELERL